MANPEHLVILKRGVEVWNKWRDENSDIIPDLSVANLKDAVLKEANLNGVVLFLSDLSGANLTRANLTDAELIGTNLRRTNLSGADLSEANLSRANLTDAELIGTNLSGADLFETNLSGANLSGANLSAANLCAANLSGANLSGADLSGAYLFFAILRDTDLFESNLREANLLQSQVIHANFHSAILTGACIEDWLINNTTNLDGVICEYIYLDVNKTERRPINCNFAPGEFASLYKKIIENTDLIISKTLEKDNNINNQGVQFYSDSIIHTWENLRFRSKTEIKIAEALDRTGVLFVPNSLARLNTSKGRENKEADFLICYNGKWGVLEVDGPFHTAERRVEEQERERIFKKNGIKVVERFDAERCYINPDEVVQEFLNMIEIGYS
jgi:uncharacterized protein YjbI with pentapeptide repeats